ncbi:MAG: hypothetical protein KGI50_05615 [Patescibacteria group bacterium]|nr:hypothetical protein [Patescibacteria group bacterium]MDE2438891.1 hypothetical protein [Patescibacteria group bacterium]
MDSLENSIFSWEELQEDVLSCWAFDNCTFKRDFGPWFKDDFVQHLAFNFDESTLTEYSPDGEVLKTCMVKLEPVYGTL